MAHIKKEDIVKVLTGKDRGKSGKVLRVMPKRQRAIVEGINTITKHVRAQREGEQGGIVKREASIHWSNLQKISE